ncbi:AEC family transporter [Vibrio sonorensis]|uniref:AEC family transporter n=1 Tax=Vibrio sonorensis TaxID=1004316 RepID=UPI000A985551|nr:AEC family transporter [Vibrio sonorensis]
MSWILLGFGCAKWLSYITKPRVDKVRAFAFSYLTPCLFFTSVYQADLADLPSLGLFASYGSCLCGLFIFIRLWLTKNGNHSVSASNIKAVAALYPNAVGVGVPLVFALYGPSAELILTGVVVFNLLVVLPVINVLMIFSGEQGFYSYRKVLTDPILLAIVTGLGFNLWGVELAPVLIEDLTNIGLIALPVILFILGAGLSFYSLTQLLNEKIGLLLTVKMVVFPLLTWLSARYLFNLSTLETQVLVLVTSLPTGVNVYLLSERYQVGKEATASVILFTTIFSLFTLFGWEMLLRHWVA